jgi:hypothetical protein
MGCGREPPAGIFDNQRSKVFLTLMGQRGGAVQAGTPMAVTEEDALISQKDQGIFSLVR